MFRLEIATSNAAFADGNAAEEIQRILRALANGRNRAAEGTGGVIHDINGNTVGQWQYTPED